MQLTEYYPWLRYKGLLRMFLKVIISRQVARIILQSNKKSNNQLNMKQVLQTTLTSKQQRAQQQILGIGENSFNIHPSNNLYRYAWR